MDSDRWSYLAVRAYAKGLLKFTSEERREERWRLREEILLGEVERDVTCELRRLLHNAEVSAAQYSAGGNVFSAHYKNAVVQYESYVKAVMPYKNVQGSCDTTALVDLWSAVYGDMHDPTVATQIAETQRYLQNKAKGVTD